jgi:nucleotide-binding universal stress UspA family protein
MLPTARLVRGDVAVLFGRRHRTHAYHRPLIATSLEDAFDRMVAAALDALAPDAREIVILHVYRIPFQGCRMLCRQERLERELEASAREAMERLVRSVDAHGVRFELATRRGEVAAVLLAELAARACDLAVIGAHRRSRAWRRHRGLAARLVEAAPCDLVVVDR